MRTIALVALLLTACGRRRPASPVPLTIALTHDGFVKVDGNALTLDELGNLLAVRREEMPLEEFAGGLLVSTLRVHLEMDDDALMLHAKWVATILAEQKIWRLSLPGGRDAPLPVGPRLGCGLPPDGLALLVRILVGEDGTCTVGDRSTRDVAEIGTWIDAAPKDGILSRIAEIEQKPGVTWRRVRPVVDMLRGRGAKRVDFGTVVPTVRVRRASPLRRSQPWTTPERWSGIRVVGYWSHDGAYEDPFDGDVEEPVSAAEELRHLLDEHRAGLALPGFTGDETLRKAAAAHAEEMSRLGYFGHSSPVPGNRSPSDRLRKLGWSEERRHVELLAKAATAEEAAEALLGNPENRKLLADRAFTQAGVAQALDSWVVLLGAGE